MRYKQLLEAPEVEIEQNLAKLDFITNYLRNNPEYMAKFHKVLKQKEREQEVSKGNPDAVNIAAKLAPKLTSPEKDHAPLIKRFIEAMIQSEGDDDDMINFVNSYGKVSYINTKKVRTEGKKQNFEAWLGGKGKVSDAFIISLFNILFEKDSYGGPGETAMALLSPTITRPEGNKGDLVIDGVKVEVKGESASGGGRFKDEASSIGIPNIQPIYDQVIQKQQAIELPSYDRISTNTTGRETNTKKGKKHQLLNVAKQIDVIDPALADQFMKEMLTGSFKKVADQYDSLFSNWRGMDFVAMHKAASKMSYLNYKTELDAKEFTHILLLNLPKRTSVYFDTNNFDQVRSLFTLNSVDFGDKQNSAAAQVLL
tara:strand:- start:60 stop:1166 length:1107 start_codon:yes stop_codon:yes gene_type:complete